MLAGAILLACGNEAGPDWIGPTGAGAGAGGAPTNVAGAPSAGSGSDLYGYGAPRGGTQVIAGQAPVALAVDDTDLYWLDSSAVAVGGLTLRRCSKSDCSTPTQMYQIGSYLPQLEVVNGVVYTLDSDGTSIAANSKAGGDARIVLQGPTSLAEESDIRARIVAWTTDGTRLAWANQTQIRSCPTKLCTEQTSQTLMDLAHGSVSVLALRDNALYGIIAGADGGLDSTSNNELFSISLADKAVTVLAEHARGEGPLAVDDQSLIWLDAGRGEPVDGPKLPTTLWDNGHAYLLPRAGSVAPNAFAQYDAWFPSTAIALDETGAYWTEGANTDGSWTGTSARLVRRAQSSLDQPQELAILAAGSASGIALDAASIYWGDVGLGAIMKLAK